MTQSNKFVKEGNSHYDNRNYTEALKSAKAAIKANEQDKNAWLLKGKSLREMGRYHDAIECFNESIKIDRRFDDAHLANCAAYLALRDYKKADNCADEALKIHRDSPYALNWKGFVTYREKRYSTAISYYEKATRLLKGKKIANIWCNKGLVYLALKRNNEAVDCFATAFLLDKNDAGSKMGMVNFFLENGDNDRADKNLAEALNIDHDYVYGFWISGGVSLVQKEKYVEAVNYFDKAIASDSFFKPLALINKGCIYLNEAKYNESIDCFDSALNEKSNYSALALICKCSALYKLNRLQEGKDCYHSALQLNNDLDFADSSDLIYKSEVGVLVFFDAYDLRAIEKLTKELQEIFKE